MLREFALLLTCVVCLLLPAAQAAQVNPSDEWLMMAHYKLRGDKPPFDDWAAMSLRVRQANEFDRPRILEEETTRLKQAFVDVDAHENLQESLGSDFSEYNDLYKEFALVALTDGMTIVNADSSNRRAFGRIVTLKITNGGLAQSWPIEPERAQKVLERLKGHRRVLLSLTLSLTGAELETTFGERVLTANIISYDVLGGWNGELGKLDSIVVKP